MWSDQEAGDVVDEPRAATDGGPATAAPSGPESDRDFAICIRDLSKCYLIYDRPQDRLKQSLLPRLDRVLGRPPRVYYREFWALRDVSFEVRRGETVGIIGRNGAGKSTLLQLVCGILHPNSGSVDIRGRVAALLELGSGFNPDFSGRENVYLYAGVLGLSRKEVDARFAEIAAFADIGDFIDQPIKTYSSGMHVRLAFAVIAHVDADILIIDEALAVGDAVFTQKCMRFIRRFQKQGTLLFVSHDMSAINNICDRAIWFDRGTVRRSGDAEQVTHAYMQQCLQDLYGPSVRLNAVGPGLPDATPAGAGAAGEDPSAPLAASEPSKIAFFENIALSEGFKSRDAEISAVYLTDRNDRPLDVVAGGEQVRLTIEAKVHREMPSPILGFFVKDRLGQSLFGEHTYTYVQPPLTALADSTLAAHFDFQLPLLPNGEYAMTVSIAEGDPFHPIQHHWLHDAMLIKVSSAKLRYGLVGIPFQSVTMYQKG
jgi:lipopolysaccharide transport system ATP-binding protein